MGCFCCKAVASEEPKKLVYSWVERKHLNPTDYVIENLSNSTMYKAPGTVGGQQFVVRNCEDSYVYVLDYSDSVTIDDCQGCTIILGPTKQSVFVRDTVNTTIIVACGQFRVRDCTSLNVSLFCSTQPVIESSREMSFSCYQLYYNQLEAQFKKANLNIWNNNWRTVYDYTWNEGDNWMLTEVPISLDFPEELNKYGITSDPVNSLVPLTKREQQSEDSCFVAFENGNEAARFVQALQSHETNLTLVRCIHRDGISVKDCVQDQNKLFNNKIPVMVVGLHIQGKHATKKCSAILQNDFPQFSTFTSKSKKETDEMIKTFFVSVEDGFQM
ncbi:protein XRP2-like [Adelges cooleyi]|uniref:protein XRP2-like n=1 Tax=Adelges cooleyi TaxID=133065 RepID=UPI00217F3157|nr:protein XRP2-like [Adelges cooleyi]